MSQTPDTLTLLRVQPTDTCIVLEGIAARVWVGTTPEGGEVHMLVMGVRANDADADGYLKRHAVLEPFTIEPGTIN